MIDHFGLLASVYERFLPKADTRRISRLMKLPVDGWVLDAGGGTGRISNMLRSLTKNLVIADVSLPMLNQARKKGLPVIAAKAEKLPFNDRQFDRILVVDALHHFKDQDRAVSEFSRVLKPGGFLVIEEPDIEKIAVKLLAFGEKIIRMDSYFHSPLEIEQMMSSSGLSARIEARDIFRAWITGGKPL